MAQTTLTLTELSKDVASADKPIAGGTAINAANTMLIPMAQEDKVLIQLNNTFAGAKVFTIKAGEYLAKGQGDLDISLAEDDVKFIMVSGDRFKNFDGYVEISFAAATTGFVQAFKMPA